MKKQFSFLLFFMGCFSFLQGATILLSSEAKDPTTLILDSPLATWDEGVPLGNGKSGVLLWGGDSRINLSIDRADLWDNRIVDEFLTPDWNYETLVNLVKKRNFGEVKRRFDSPYAIPYPTKLPGGRLVLQLPQGQTVDSFSLAFSDGIGQIKLKDGSSLQVVMCQKESSFLIIMDNPIDQLAFLVPGESRNDGQLSSSAGDFSSLSYPKAIQFVEGDFSGFFQPSLTDFSYGIVQKSFQQGEKWCIAVSILAGNYGDGEDSEKRFFVAAQERLDFMEKRGWQFYIEESKDWWKHFNEKSSVSIGDSAILYQYNFVKYLYGAGARKGTPPIPLQGVWTADTNGLPPWKGDFHFDLNVQLTYWPSYMANLEDQAEGLIDFMDSLLSVHQEFSQDFFGVEEGIAVPGVMTLDGKPMGGWPQYSLSPTMTIWVAHHYYWHWKYFGKGNFLEERAYPYLKGVGNLFLGLLEEDKKGVLRLPLSTSPEIYDASPKSWLKPNSNFDQSLLSWLFSSLEEMASELNNGEEVKWGEVSKKMAPLVVDFRDRLMFAPGRRVTESHRHHSQLMGIYPLQTLDPQGADREVVIASLDELKRHKRKKWTGYSFSWAACMEAIAGRAEMADYYLSLFTYAYVLDNGFHVNGDQKNTGTSTFSYRPFTLEGNFAAMQAVHLMLLQNRGDLVVLFPALPQRWGDVSFKKLQVYGGFLISATSKNGKADSLEIQAKQDGELILSIENVSDELVEKILKHPAKKLASASTILLQMKMGEAIKF